MVLCSLGHVRGGLYSLLDPDDLEPSAAHVAKLAHVGLRLRVGNLAHAFLARGGIQSFLDPVPGRTTHRPGRNGLAGGNGQRHEQGDNPPSLVVSSSSSPSSASDHDANVTGADTGSVFIGSHDTAVERFARVLFALATRHVGSSFSANLFGSLLLTLPDGFSGLMGRLENTRDESRRHAA